MRPKINNYSKESKSGIYDFRVLSEHRSLLAETPIWDGRIKRLYWTDLFEGTVHRFDPETGLDESVETNSCIGAAIPCNVEGKLLVAIDDGLMILDFDSGDLELIAAPETEMDGFRYNDTRCDAIGRIFTSTVSSKYPDPDFDPDKIAGKFFMIEPDGKVTVLVDHIAQYNTIFFDNGNNYLFVVDTYNRKLLRFDYAQESGVYGKPETVIVFDDMPDGVSVDIEDHIYVCHWGEKKHITVWDIKDFSFIHSIPFPVKNVCCGGFGGQDMKDFYVATSSYGLLDDDPDFENGAGAIFFARSITPGKPENFYRIKNKKGRK